MPSTPISPKSTQLRVQSLLCSSFSAALTDIEEKYLEAVRRARDAGGESWPEGEDLAEAGAVTLKSSLNSALGNDSSVRKGWVAGLEKALALAKGDKSLADIAVIHFGPADIEINTSQYPSVSVTFDVQEVAHDVCNAGTCSGYDCRIKRAQAKDGLAHLRCTLLARDEGTGSDGALSRWSSSAGVAVGDTTISWKKSV